MTFGSIVDWRFVWYRCVPCISEIAKDKHEVAFLYYELNNQKGVELSTPFYLTPLKKGRAWTKVQSLSRERQPFCRFAHQVRSGDISPNRGIPRLRHHRKSNWFISVGLFVMLLRDLNMEPQTKWSVFAKQKWSVQWTVQWVGRTGENSSFSATLNLIWTPFKLGFFCFCKVLV